MKTNNLLSHLITFTLTASMLFSITACHNSGNAKKQKSENESSVSASNTALSGNGEASEQSSDSSLISSKETKNQLINDNGIFSANYEKAYERTMQMTLDEKIGQMFYARCPDGDAAEIAKKYHLGGYVLFGKDFEDKTKDEVKETLQSYITSQAIPMTLSVDEEGGTVTRISAKESLSSHEFQSARELYAEGGLERIQSDAEEKAKLLKELYIDTNLAPVCDISLDENDFMYDRSIGLDADKTSDFVKTVTETSQKNGVSVTLKHFPGYGNNVDTHTGIAIDDRSYENFEQNDFKPFEAGIESGAHLVLVSHNIVNCMDDKMPASISPKVHEILRNQLHFTGIIITDDLAMDAISEYTGSYSPAVAAVLAGNDMILIDDIESSFNEIKAAVNDGTIDENVINTAVMRILAWKYTTGIMK